MLVPASMLAQACTVGTIQPECISKLQMASLAAASSFSLAAASSFQSRPKLLPCNSARGMSLRR